MTEIKQLLEEMGLSNKEAEIYLALLNLGEETASRISEVANLNRVTTYSLLKSLGEKGFCSVFEKNKVKYFKPSKPEQILGLLEERKKRFILALPLFKEKERKIEEKPEVALFEGKKGITTLMTLILDDCMKSREVLGYGNVSAGEKSIGLQSYYWRKSRLDRKIKMRAVSDSLGDIEHRSPPIWKKITEVRINKQLEKNNTYTIIGETFIGIFIPSEEPIAILIKNKQVVEKEKFNFEIIWNKAK